MNDYKVTVFRLVELNELHHKDRNFMPEGEYFYSCGSSEVALDLFHSNTPVACLDDYEITVEKCDDYEITVEKCDD